MVEVDALSFLAIVTSAALAAGIASRIAPWLLIPVVVLEILIGILIGPQILDLAQSNDFTEFFANLGLAMLFFFAGYEISFERIGGSPARLGIAGWAISLVVAYAAGGVLLLVGVVASVLFVGTALATTAIGTLIPILSDSGEMDSRFGRLLLGAGAAGEFGPILVVTLLFSTRTTLASTLVLAAFGVLALGAAAVAMRSVDHHARQFRSNPAHSGQLAVRATIVVVFALTAVAAELGLDVLLGGFVAGVIVSTVLGDRENAAFESKLNAVGYGFLIPFFFIVTGIDFDLDSLVDEPIRLLELPLFLALFLVVRGLPAMYLYREALALRDRVALALFSATELPLVVAITTIAVERGDMDSGTAASLVGAAVASTALFPLIALRIREGGEAEPTSLTPANVRR